VPPVTRSLVSNMLAALAGDALVTDDVPQPLWRGLDPGPPPGRKGPPGRPGPSAGPGRLR
jgi:hypothetical protein